MSKLRFITLSLVSVFLASLFTPLIPQKVTAVSGSEFQAGRIIDDAKFFAASPMGVAEIQAFLNAKVPVCDTWGTQMHSSGQTRAQYSAANGVSTPFTCLKDYQTGIPARAPESGLCNGITASGATAAEILYMVGTSCGINPQVLIVLIQKEQSLITDDWPWPVQYRSATGYGCPDTAPCDSEYYGFFNQVYMAARQFKRYALYPHLYNFRANMNASVRYNPNVNCGSSTVFIQNQATAGLYNYTPYQPNAAALANLYGTGDGCSAYGNRNFWRIFNDWFGSTFGPPDYSCRDATNVSGAVTGERIVANRFAGNGPDHLRLVVPNNTSTACIEAHTWANGSYQQWSQHIATNYPAIDPATSKMLSADTNGDGIDEAYMVNYSGTASGMIEIHGWASDLQHWASHVATNRPVVSSANAEVVVADTNGDGRDEFYFVEYRNNGSGRLEVHGWTANFQQWSSHIATNYGSINPRDAQVITADLNRDFKDEFYLVNYTATASGMLEIHGWTANFQQWVLHQATNRPALTHGVADGSADFEADVIAGDRNADGQDELQLVQYANTGSGRIEVHTWGNNLQHWVSHIATSQGTL